VTTLTLSPALAIAPMALAPSAFAALAAVLVCTLRYAVLLPAPRGRDERRNCDPIAYGDIPEEIS